MKKYRDVYKYIYISISSNLKSVEHNSHL